MTEYRAWITQAASDYGCISRLYVGSDSSTYCHAIAKCQQAMEKSVKALVASLAANRTLTGIRIGPAHAVTRFLGTLQRLPKLPENRDIQKSLLGLFGSHIAGEIKSLDALAPKWPAPNALPARNTEYPFGGNERRPWRCPAQDGVFSKNEVARYRALAFRIVNGCSSIISALERVPVTKKS